MIKLLLLALVCALLLQGAATSDTTATTTTNVSPVNDDVARKSEKLVVEAAEVGSDGSVVDKYELLSSES